jgi:enoyl-CoA hydratase/carnithine racemase
LLDIYSQRSEQSSTEPAYRTFNVTVDDDCWTMEQTQRQLAIIPALHKPVIAKVHGNCLAGGTDLAFSCDIVLAADDCRIGFPAARANGTPPTNFWMYHCGPQWVKRLLFTGDIILDRDAARIDLVLDSSPPEELDADAERLARRIALVDSELLAALLAAHKRVVNLALELAAGGGEHHVVRRFELCPSLGKRMSDFLIHADRPVEDDAVLVILDSVSERGAADADRLRGDEDALGVQAVEDVLEPSPFLADPILDRHRQVVDEQFVRVDRLAPHLVDLAHGDVATVELSVEQARALGGFFTCSIGVVRARISMLSATCAVDIHTFLPDTR